MTQIIEKKDWKLFFGETVNSFADWETIVRILNDDSGSQMMSEGLPFSGLTFEEEVGRSVIELTVGMETDDHQSHTIVNPTKVAFEPSGVGPAGTLDIEDESGTKTLITFIQPIPVPALYSAAEIVLVS